LFLILLSLVLFFISATEITGAVIGGRAVISFLWVAGLVILLGGMYLFFVTGPLDVIIVPTGPSLEDDINRAQRGLEVYQKRGASLVIVSGERNKPEEEQQNKRIMGYLYDNGIPAEKLVAEISSSDSEENLAESYSAAKNFYGRGNLKIGIATSPGHGNRFRYLFNRAIKMGAIDGGGRLEILKTPMHKGEWTEPLKLLELKISDGFKSLFG